MTKWEYVTMPVGLPDLDGKPDEPEDTANAMTAGGWELFTVDNDIMYFRRPKAILVHIGPTEHKLETPSSGPNV